jgi:hypothetical protein
MFCAGLLLSIADLLKFFDLQSPTYPFPQTPRASLNQQHVPSAFPPPEHGGYAAAQNFSMEVAPLSR